MTLIDKARAFVRRAFYYLRNPLDFVRSFSSQIKRAYYAIQGVLESLVEEVAFSVPKDVRTHVPMEFGNRQFSVHFEQAVYFYFKELVVRGALAGWPYELRWDIRDHKKGTRLIFKRPRRGAFLEPTIRAVLEALLDPIGEDGKRLPPVDPADDAEEIEDATVIEEVKSDPVQPDDDNHLPPPPSGDDDGNVETSQDKPKPIDPGAVMQGFVNNLKTSGILQSDELKGFAEEVLGSPAIPNSSKPKAPAPPDSEDSKEGFGFEVVEPVDEAKQAEATKKALVEDLPKPDVSDEEWELVEDKWDAEASLRRIGSELGVFTRHFRDQLIAEERDREARLGDRKVLEDGEVSEASPVPDSRVLHTNSVTLCSQYAFFFSTIRLGNIVSSPGEREADRQDIYNECFIRMRDLIKHNPGEVAEVMARVNIVIDDLNDHSDPVKALDDSDHEEAVADEPFATSEPMEFPEYDEEKRLIAMDEALFLNALQEAIDRTESWAVARKNRGEEATISMRAEVLLKDFGGGKLSKDVIDILAEDAEVRSFVRRSVRGTRRVAAKSYESRRSYSKFASSLRRLLRRTVEQLEPIS